MLQVVEVLLTEHLDLLNVVELEIEVLQVPQVFQLLQPHLVIGQVEGSQVLEVAQIFLNHIDYLF